jgi:O-acetyl-ADP-ribose deacetylase (regulator of RNase III)
VITVRDYLRGRVLVRTGDITTLTVDAIVNAANPTLLGGSGVDGAIHRKGGPEILAECRELRRASYPNGLPTGDAVITTGGRLPARCVIHTVGPVWGQSQNSAEQLASCYRRSIGLADLRALHEIAFPAISTGAYGYPKDEAARVASAAIGAALKTARSVTRVHLVFFTPADASIFLLHQQFEPIAAGADGR